MIKVSIIIPIYKVELYLQQCLDSVLVQTYRNIEIILVDDGSPDNCPAICDKYAERDSRIKVIHKENGGLSDARNAGLRIATGDYYYFVDSDDVLPEYSIEWMIHCILENRADMVIAGFERFRDDIQKPFFSTCPDGNESIRVMTREEAMYDFFRDGCQAWAVLYKKHIHEGIYFPYGEINEDEAIVFQILDRCERVVVTDKVVYNYRNRDESITTTTFSLKKLAWYRHCKANLEWIRAHHPELTALAAARYRGAVLWSLTEIALSNQPYKHEVKLLRSELCREKRLFEKIKFQYRTDYFRMLLLMYLPFGVYRFLIRSKRRSL